MRRSGYVVAVCLLTGSAFSDRAELFARQKRAVEAAVGQPVVNAQPGGAAVPAAGQPGGQPQPNGGKPAAEAGATPGATPGATGAQPAAGPSKPVTRGDRPQVVANPTELKARPDKDGKVRFNFQGQPWLGVLEWLAQISDLSLDWQEVPGDHLNLTTQRSYTVTEARDLINRHLLDRGYTMLRNGEVLTVANVKKLDPSLVPRVRPDDLKTRDSHEFVKVSFALDWLIAEQAVEELKPMLSQNGKLTALKTTNRIEAMDAVSNLREIYEILQDEQSRDGQEQLVREFQFKHIRAGDVEPMLRELLGMQKASAGGGGGGNNQQEMMQQQMQQQMQQMQMQMQQQGGQRPPPGAAEKKIFLVVNSRRNSVLAQAPADKMAVIAQAVKTLDVENAAGGSLLQAMNNTRIYRLAAIDPEPFVKVLSELGNLDPLTQIKVDRDNRAIIVSGAIADHFVITELLKKLDGSDRRFEVVRLRRLEADYVAGTIEFMMLGGEKKKEESNPFSYYRYGLEMNTPKKETKKFRVSADTDNNRLLLWANEVELKEVYLLLEKLGEVPPRDGNPDTLRVFEMGSPVEAEKLLEKLRQLQPDLLPPQSADRGSQTPSTKPAVKEPQAQRSPARSSVPPTPQTRADTERRPGQSGRILQSGKPVTRPPQVTLARLQAPAEESTDETPQSPTPPSREESEAFQKRLKRAIQEYQTILPTFAPENPGEEPEETTVPPDTETPAARDRELEPAAVHPPANKTAGPVQVTVTQDGRLVISSRDTRALDTLEEAIGQMSPPRRDFKIFHLKNRNTWAYGVVLNLEKFFGSEKDKKNNSRFDYWYGYAPSNNSEETPASLSKRRIPKFISDTDSRTILVTGADPEQLRVIQELIDIYDRPDDSSAKALRLHRVFQMKYSKARVVADAVKEVYRDLLSENDPALQQAQNNKDQKPASSERSYTYIYGASDGDSEKEPEAPIKFKGLLSLGVDEISNTIIVSSQEGLLENIGQMIIALDEAARPTQSTIQVLRVDRAVETSGLQSRLAKILTRPQPQPQQGRGNPNQPQQPGQPQGQGNQQGGVAQAGE